MPIATPTKRPTRKPGAIHPPARHPARLEPEFLPTLYHDAREGLHPLKCLVRQPGDFECFKFFVTPELARQILTEAPYTERQRKLNIQSACEYEVEMRDARFQQGSALEIVFLLDGTIQLHNGKTRLHALVSSGVGQWFTLIQRRFSNDEEAAYNYAKTDIGRARSVSDAIRATQLDRRMGLDGGQTLAVVTAIKVMLEGYDKKVSGHEKTPFSGLAALALEWTEEAQRYFEAIKGGRDKTVKRLRNASMVGVALRTFQADASQASAFWERVSRFHTDEPDTDPCYMLARWLDSHVVNVDGGQSGYARVAADAWNRFVTGSKKKSDLTYDLTKQIRIYGTRYDGKTLLATAHKDYRPNEYRGCKIKEER